MSGSSNRKLCLSKWLSHRNMHYLPELAVWRSAVPGFFQGLIMSSQIETLLTHSEAIALRMLVFIPVPVASLV